MSYGKANIDFYFLLLKTPQIIPFILDQLMTANLVLHITLAEDFWNVTTAVQESIPSCLVFYYLRIFGFHIIL